MNLTRWNPFRELEEASTRLNRLFARPYAENDLGFTTFDWAPTCDIVETVEEYQVKAELPEVRKEDVKITVDGDLLKIQGERKQDKEEKGRKFHRIERSYGSFMRTFTLPENIDPAKVRAEFKDGILSVRIPKQENPKSKSMDIKVS